MPSHTNYYWIQGLAGPTIAFLGLIAASLFPFFLSSAAAEQLRATPLTSEFLVSSESNGSGGKLPQVAALGNGNFLIVYERLPSPAESDRIQSRLTGAWARVWDSRGQPQTPLTFLGEFGIRKVVSDDSDNAVILSTAGSVLWLDTSLRITGRRDFVRTRFSSSASDIAMAKDRIALVIGGGAGATIRQFDASLDEIADPIVFGPIISEHFSLHSRSAKIAVDDDGTVALLQDENDDFSSQFRIVDMWLRAWKSNGEVLFEPIEIFEGLASIQNNSLSFLESGAIRVLGSEIDEDDEVFSTRRLYSRVVDLEGNIKSSDEVVVYSQSEDFADSQSSFAAITTRQSFISTEDCMIYRFDDNGFATPLSIEAQTPIYTGCKIALNDAGHAFVVWPYVSEGNQHVRGQVFDLDATPGEAESLVQLGNPNLCVGQSNSAQTLTWPQELEIRVGSAEGRLFKRSGFGEATTGLWARQGLVFFAIEPESGVLRDWVKVRLDQSQSACPSSGISLDPEYLCGSPQSVNVAWSYPELEHPRVQIRLNSPNGRIFQGGPVVGSAETGPWVRHRMRFFAVSGETVLGAATAIENCASQN